MASGGYGRGGRGAALLQALNQPARKPGDNGQPTVFYINLIYESDMGIYL